MRTHAPSCYLEEKGNKDDRMLVHHEAQEALHGYLQAAALTDKDAPISHFLSRAGELIGRQLHRTKVFEMVRGHTHQGAVLKNISCHASCSTSIALFRQAGGRIERAQAFAHHADSRTTKMNEPSNDDVTLEDIELVQL